MATSSHISDGFNPYHQWLGIPPAEHPPNHYRLLGLATFEDDGDVISNAADRQMGHVKSFASGPQAAQSQTLLNELAKARLCLLNPTRKAEYDEWLAEQICDADAMLDESGEYELEEDFGALEVAPAVMPTIATPVATLAKRRKRRKNSGVAVSLGVMVVGGGIVAGLLWYAAQQRPGGVATADASAAPNAGQSAAPSGAPRAEAPTVPGEPAPGMPPQGTAPRRPPPGTMRPGTTRPRTTEPRPSRTPRTALQPSTPEVEPREPRRGPDSRSSFEDPRPGRPPQTPRAAERANLFASLPTAVALPGEGSQVAELARWEIESYQLAELQLELLNPDFAGRGGPELYLHRLEKQENEAVWLLLDEAEVDRFAADQQGEALAESALASLRVAPGTLAFQWAEGAADPERRDRVRMGVVRFRHRGKTHDVQLREPLIDSLPVVLGNWANIFEHRIDEADLSPLPPMRNVALRVEFLQGFPATDTVQGDQRALPEEDQLMLQFTRADYAGVAAHWQSKGKKLAISIAPGFTLESSKGIELLSRDHIQGVEQGLINKRRKAEQEYNKRVNNRRALQRNLRAAQNRDIRLPGGGTTPQLIAMKKAGIAKANQAIAQNESRITSLRSFGTAVNNDLQTRIPTLRQLATDLEGNATLGVELYYRVGDAKVVLFQKGLSEEAEGSLGGGW